MSFYNPELFSKSEQNRVHIGGKTVGGGATGVRVFCFRRLAVGLVGAGPARYGIRDERRALPGWQRRDLLLRAHHRPPPDRSSSHRPTVAAADVTGAAAGPVREWCVSDRYAALSHDG